MAKRGGGGGGGVQNYMGGVALIIWGCCVWANIIEGGGASSSSSSCRERQPACGPSQFSFYLHNMVYSPLLNNSYFNSVYGAQPPNISFPNPTAFGVTATFEDPLTEGPENTSTQIGVAQGFYFFDSLVDFTLFQLFTANITAGTYTGTLDIFGQLREIDPVRYLTVIGGTGDFLLARGLASCRLIELYRGPPARWTLSFDLDLYY